MHGQSHWQVTTLQNGFSSPVAESWQNYENWYFEINTQDGDDLTDEKIEGLQENTDYIWRVRYRDREMNWSNWSNVASFSTGASTGSINLLANPGAEIDLENWETVEGVVEALTAQLCDGISPYEGEKYFGVGGLCEHSEVARAIQNVDVSMFSDSIDAGVLYANFGGYLSNFGGADLPEMKVNYLDENDMEIGMSEIYSTLNSSWTLINAISAIPLETITIQMELKGTRNAGTDNDSYFDAFFLKVGKENMDCSMLSSSHSLNNHVIRTLEIAPNPMNQISVIAIPGQSQENVYLQMVDFTGIKISVKYKRVGDTFEIEKGDLSAGNYIIWMRDGNRIIGKGKIVIL